VRLNAASLLVIDGSHLDYVLQFAKGPFYLTEFPVNCDRLDRREIGLLGLNQVLAFESLLLFKVYWMLKKAKPSLLHFPAFISAGLDQANILVNLSARALDLGNPEIHYVLSYYREAH
jgi:hypothetical protein